MAPRILKAPETLKVIKNAINDFGKAKEEDKELRDLYDAIGAAGKAQPYLNDEEGHAEPDKVRQVETKLDGGRQLSPAGELLPIVAKANKSLRAAANHLSLAFHVGNRLLFLGDLEKNEIKQVVAALQKKRRTNFFVTITPHHGTHWHDDLLTLRSVLAASSIGKHLIRHFCQEFETSFADLCLATYTNGDIHISTQQPGRRKASFQS